MTSQQENARRTEILSRIDEVLIDAALDENDPHFYRGKVRDVYDVPGGRRVMVATDRQSAFDQVLAAVPFKGQVLTATARFWFEATQDILPNHVIAYPDPNVSVVKSLTMLPVEVVVRDYMTGSTSTSIWPMYQSGRRNMYGISFPDGLKKNDKLPQTIVTPTTKGGTGEHDRPITPAEIIEEKLLTADQWAEVEKAALALFARGRDLAARQGLILVDTKYEFGWDEQGHLTLADEIHTPDSSRYWIAESYEARRARGEEPDSLDKEFLRLWIAARCDPYKDPIPAIPPETLADFSARYIALYEKISGQTFVLPPRGADVKERVLASLKPFLAA